MPTTSSRKKTRSQPATKISKRRAQASQAVRKLETLHAYCVPTVPDWEPADKVRFKRAKNPIPRGTLGDFGLAVEVTGPGEFPETMLIQPYEPRALIGIDATTVRMFRWDEAEQTLKPVWSSGNNAVLGFVWSKIRRSGLYVALGLPRDRLLQEALQEMARTRRSTDTDSEEVMEVITRRALEIFVQPSEQVLDELRQFVTQVEIQTGLGQFAVYEIRRGGGAHILPFPLPGDATLKQFRARLDKLETPRGGLPEEALFSPPELPREGEPPWARPDLKWDGVDQRALGRLHMWADPNLVIHIPPWFFSQDWWMYHHDETHTGHASGSSNINSTNVGTLIRLCSVPMNGEVFSIPCIVDGKVYVGTGNKAGGGGSLCRIDLSACSTPGYTPDVLYSFTPQVGGGAGQGDGIGSSPAIVANHAYFCSTDGRVFCWDINHNHLDWSTNLRYPDLPKNQPVNNPNASCWTSPLVVNGKVYVGCGEGERGAFGFVYCLNANTGSVIWLFCTNQFSTAADNSPNVIPNSTVPNPLIYGPPPAGFSSQPDPPQRGASLWSSCAYDAGLNRIYVGTGNAIPDDPLPDPRYASGILSLDANTGTFRAFYQPTPGDSYRPTDLDVDVPGSPTLYTVGGRRVVGIGSKNGSYHILDANTLVPIVPGRQLLPKDAVTNALLPNVDPNGSPHENMWGVFGTAAVDWNRGVLFVGLGGYGGIDPPTTPFIRALDWNNLNDAWPTAVQAVGGNQVRRYTAATPPLYTTSEAGLSSPAVVNDVVFVSTTKPGFYAFDTATGACLWSATSLTGSWPLGPAISGNYVVLGVGNNVYVYTLGRHFPRPPIIIDLRELILRHWPWPPPPPPDGLREEVTNLLERERM